MHGEHDAQRQTKYQRTPEVPPEHFQKAYIIYIYLYMCSVNQNQSE